MTNNNDGNNSDYKIHKVQGPRLGHHCIILLNGSCKVIAHIPTFQVTLGNSYGVELVSSGGTRTERRSLGSRASALTPQHCSPGGSCLTTKKDLASLG